MERSKARSQYEAQLSKAHQSLYWAIDRAELCGDEGAVSDLQGIQDHLSAMLRESVDGRKHKPQREAEA